MFVFIKVDDTQQESKTEVVVPTKHQFSDADDSDGMDEDVDEIDEDDEEDDEYEGDSTPKLRSRSTSPQPVGITSLSVTATAAIHGYSLTSLPDTDVRPQSSVRRTGSDHRPVLATDQREKSVDEDSLTMLSPEQTSFLFDPYSSCLLSPGWESPIREPSPSRLRYPSPRRELSPRGRSSPRWDTSPLRPGSPGFTPIQHLSPASIERPMSPGTELAGKRESSVRGRQRVVLRAVSPRRGSHQHKGSGDKTRHQAKMEMAQQQAAFEMEMVCITQVNCTAAKLGFSNKDLLTDLDDVWWKIRPLAKEQVNWSFGTDSEILTHQDRLVWNIFTIFS